MAQLKLYEKYVEKLVKCLPMDDAHFIANLSANQLLPGDTENKIKISQTQPDKASYFLCHVIKPALDIGDFSGFKRLLSIMHDCGYDHVQKLSCQIEQDMGEQIKPPDTSLAVAPSNDNKPKVYPQKSTPVEFTVNEKMESAFGRLIKKFIGELNRPPPYDQSLVEMKALCINYCDTHHHEKCDFLSSVSSMDDFFSKIAEPHYCNFLNLSLLKHLAECTENECLKTSVKNYDKTFKNVKIKKVLKSTGIGYKVKAIRSGIRSKYYEIMFIKLIRKGITYGQVKQIEIKICSRVIHIHPNSLIKKWYRRGSVYLGWLIPSCLVSAAYHSACTNTVVFGQLGIKYLIIGNYKIKPPLPVNRAILETPMRLFCKQYQYLVHKLQPVKVSVYMFAKGLLDKRDYTMIMNAPTDHIKNCMIIEHVRHQSSSYLFAFLDVLQQIGDQKCICDALISALASAGFLKLSDDCDIMLDEDEDDDYHVDNSFRPCLDHYVKSCLKINCSVKGKMQHLLTDHKELKETKLPDMNIQYLYLIDSLCKLMESCDPRVFIDKCADLMVSNIHNIPLFSSDEVLKDFGEYHNASIMLRYLMCYFTWCDLSVIQELLETCGYPDGMRLLKNFKHQIDYARPLTEYSIPNSHSLMIPSDGSPYTVMFTQYELEHSSLSLRHIEVVKSLITESCEITPICCSFLAKAIDYQFFHWLIPKSVAPLVIRKAQENCSYLHKRGLKKMSIFPTSECFFTNDNKKFLLFYGDLDVDKVDLDVDKADPHANKADPHVDKVDTHVDTVKADGTKKYQQELNEMKVKYNVLQQENAELHSELDIANKEVNNLKILVKQSRELKDRKQHDTAKKYQQELNEMKVKYNVLRQENAELHSELDVANKEVNNLKILVKQSRELKDRKQHDTAKVMESDSVKLSEKMKDYHSIIDKKQLEIDELQKQLKSLTTEYFKMEQKVMESDSVKLSEKIKDYQSILDKKQLKIDELDKQLESLATEYFQMEQKHNDDKLALEQGVFKSLPPPTNVKATASTPHRVEVTWDQSSDVTGYLISCTTTALYAGGKNVVVDGGDTSYIFTDLVENTPYDITVHGLARGIRKSLCSKEVSVKTPTTAPSSPPQDIKVLSDDPASLKLSWQPPLEGDCNGPITGYVIQYARDGLDDNMIICVPNDTDFTISGLFACAEYSITVAAVNDNGTGPFSKPVVATSGENTPSEPQQLEIVSVFSTSVTWRWMPPKYPNGIITKYSAHYDGKDIEKFGNVPDKLTDTIEGLSPNSVYILTIKAHTRVGPGSPVSFPVKTRLPAPTNVKATVLTPNSVEVSWDQLSDATGYLISCTTTASYAGNKNVIVNGGDTISYTLTKLVENTPYDITVHGITNDGRQSDHSTAVSIKTQKAAPSSPPENIKVLTADPASLQVSWQPPSDDHCNEQIIGYVIQYARVGSDDKMIMNLSNNTKLTISGLFVCAQYSVTVAAVNVNGTGPFSISVEATSGEDTPSKPQQLEMDSISSTSVTLRWMPPKYPNGIITKYSVHYDGKDIEKFGNVPDTLIDTIEGLSPNSVYVLTIKAHTRVGPGSPVSLLVKTSNTNLTTFATEKSANKVFCSKAQKKLQKNHKELSSLPYEKMSKILLAKQVFTDQEKLQIARAELIGISKMEQVLDIVMKSLKCNEITKYKAFIEAMEESGDVTLQKKAKELDIDEED